jgi:hypothetical protein
VHRDVRRYGSLSVSFLPILFFPFLHAAHAAILSKGKPVKPNAKARDAKAQRRPKRTKIYHEGHRRHEGKEKFFSGAYGVRRPTLLSIGISVFIRVHPWFQSNLVVYSLRLCAFRPWRYILVLWRVSISHSAHPVILSQCKPLRLWRGAGKRKRFCAIDTFGPPVIFSGSD